MHYCIPKGEAGEKSNLALETYFNSKGRQVYKMLIKSKLGLNAMVSYQVLSTELNRMTTEDLHKIYSATRKQRSGLLIYHCLDSESL